MTWALNSAGGQGAQEQNGNAAMIFSLFVPKLQDVHSSDPRTRRWADGPSQRWTTGVLRAQGPLLGPGQPSRPRPLPRPRPSRGPAPRRSRLQRTPAATRMREVRQHQHDTICS